MRSAAVMLGVFALTIFCSASLLFLVEPMVGKMMLPLLGGTPAVWNTCMVFFQAVLLAGYAYADATTRWLGPRRQAALHLGMLLLPFLFFLVNGPLAVNRELIAGREANPIPALLLVLSLTVGVPMFVVCTSAPLLQKWFASTSHPAARDPYFLYAASNFGSMLALLGYPVVIEPFFTLAGQRYDWAIGYGLLVALTAGCAYLMWKSAPAPAPAEGVPPAPAVPGPEATSEAIKPAPQRQVTPHRPRGRKKDRPDRAPAATPPPPVLEEGPQVRPVTWLRRLRWVMLAAVPSSLMLGVTTYVTTDIAAIPLLWVLPLALYLLTFIIVFAHIPARVQSVAVWAGLLLVLAAVCGWIAPMLINEETHGAFLWAIRIISLVLVPFSLKILSLRDPRLIHRVMIMFMPLLVLLMVFLMFRESLTGEKPNIVSSILLHLGTLFVVAMVCHGELARDRPDPAHLTEYFLWMSFGGVAGGLFNALFAPLAFNALVEYPLGLAVACLLLPPLTGAAPSPLSRYADLALGGVFLAIGALLLALAYRHKGLPDPDTLRGGPWRWGVAGLAGGLALGLAYAWFGRRAGEPGSAGWVDRLLDVALPLSLGLLVLGLYWGLPSGGMSGRLDSLAKVLGVEKDQFRAVLTFGLPAVLCYTFVERSVRFGLGVGAVLLVSGLSAYAAEGPLYQQRSFFGVLKVEDGWTKKGDAFYRHRSLTHGTTLHGKQFLEEGLRDIPLTYYHRTGPVGHVFRAYNTDPKRAVGVIGLGTGTMACYGLPGQRLTFYDIDPVVRSISYDTDRYFTYVADAKARGADVGLVMGDARLTLDRQDLAREEDRYGLLVIDAFSSDAIPVHLITLESLEMYLRKMREDGIICFHVSNRYLNLVPVLANQAERLGIAGYHFSDDDNSAAGKNRSHWVALARKPEYLAKLLKEPRWEQEPARLSLVGLSCFPAVAAPSFPDPGAGLARGLGLALGQVADRASARKGEAREAPTAWKPIEPDPRVGVWTDDYSNLLRVFAWR